MGSRRRRDTAIDAGDSPAALLRARHEASAAWGQGSQQDGSVAGSGRRGSDASRFGPAASEASTLRGYPAGLQSDAGSESGWRKGTTATNLLSALEMVGEEDEDDGETRGTATVRGDAEDDDDDITNSATETASLRQPSLHHSQTHQHQQQLQHLMSEGALGSTGSLRYPSGSRPGSPREDVQSLEDRAVRAAALRALKPLRSTAPSSSTAGGGNSILGAGEWGNPAAGTATATNIKNMQGGAVQPVSGGSAAAAASVPHHTAADEHVDHTAEEADDQVSMWTLQFVDRRLEEEFFWTIEPAKREIIKAAFIIVMVASLVSLVVDDLRKRDTARFTNIIITRVALVVCFVPIGIYRVYFKSARRLHRPLSITALFVLIIPYTMLQCFEIAARPDGLEDFYVLALALWAGPFLAGLNFRDSVAMAAFLLIFAASAIGITEELYTEEGCDAAYLLIRCISLIVVCATSLLGMYQREKERRLTFILRRALGVHASERNDFALSTVIDLRRASLGRPALFNALLREMTDVTLGANLLADTPERQEWSYARALAGGEAKLDPAGSEIYYDRQVARLAPRTLGPRDPVVVAAGERGVVAAVLTPAPALVAGAGPRSVVKGWRSATAVAAAIAARHGLGIAGNGHCIIVFREEMKNPGGRASVSAGNSNLHKLGKSAARAQRSAADVREAPQIFNPDNEDDEDGSIALGHMCIAAAEIAQCMSELGTPAYAGVARGDWELRYDCSSQHVSLRPHGPAVDAAVAVAVSQVLPDDLVPSDAGPAVGGSRSMRGTSAAAAASASAAARGDSGSAAAYAAQSAIEAGYVPVIVRSAKAPIFPGDTQQQAKENRLAVPRAEGAVPAASVSSRVPFASLYKCEVAPVSSSSNKRNNNSNSNNNNNNNSNSDSYTQSSRSSGPSEWCVTAPAAACGRAVAVAKNSVRSSGMSSAGNSRRGSISGAGPDAMTIASGTVNTGGSGGGAYASAIFLPGSVPDTIGGQRPPTGDASSDVIEPTRSLAQRPDPAAWDTEALAAFMQSSTHLTDEVFAAMQKIVIKGRQTGRKSSSSYRVMFNTSGDATAAGPENMANTAAAGSTVSVTGSASGGGDDDTPLTNTQSPPQPAVAATSATRRATEVASGKGSEFQSKGLWLVFANLEKELNYRLHTYTSSLSTVRVIVLFFIIAWIVALVGDARRGDDSYYELGFLRFGVAVPAMIIGLGMTFICPMHVYVRVYQSVTSVVVYVVGITAVLMLLVAPAHEVGSYGLAVHRTLMAGFCNLRLRTLSSTVLAVALFFSTSFLIFYFDDITVEENRRFLLYTLIILGFGCIYARFLERTSRNLHIAMAHEHLAGERSEAVRAVHSWAASRLAPAAKVIPHGAALAGVYAVAVYCPASDAGATDDDAGDAMFCSGKARRHHSYAMDRSTSEVITSMDAVARSMTTTPGSETSDGSGGGGGGGARDDQSRREEALDVRVVRACGPWVIAAVRSPRGESAALEVAREFVRRVTAVRDSVTGGVPSGKANTTNKLLLSPKPTSTAHTFHVSAAVAEGPLALAAVSAHGAVAGRTIELTGQPVFAAMVLAARAANGKVVTANPTITDME